MHRKTVLFNLVCDSAPIVPLCGSRVMSKKNPEFFSSGQCVENSLFFVYDGVFCSLYCASLLRSVCQSSRVAFCECSVCVLSSLFGFVGLSCAILLNYKQQTITVLLILFGASALWAFFVDTLRNHNEFGPPWRTTPKNKLGQNSLDSDCCCRSQPVCSFSMVLIVFRWVIIKLRVKIT